MTIQRLTLLKHLNKTDRFKPFSLAISAGFAIISIAPLGLTGCGASDDRKEPVNAHGDHDHDGHDHSVDTEVAAEINQGRLLIAADENDQAYVYSLAKGKIIQTVDLDIQADALVTSPSGGYALVLDRTNQAVKFYDSGLRVEDHGDHDHPYASDASAMPLQLNYTRPVHYQVREDQAGLFFDGLGSEGNPIANPKQVAGFVLVTDADIKAGKLAYQALNTNMHGTAEPRGDFVVTTGRFDSEGTTLADTTAVYHQHGDHYHLKQTFDTKCPALHGSGSVTDFSVFACSNGLLSVKQSGDSFSAEKLAYPTSMTTTECLRHDGSSRPSRVGSFATHHHHDYLIGTACGQPYHIDPNTQAITPIIWTTDENAKVVSYAFDAHGEHLLLLDNSGTLHILDSTAAHRTLASIKIFADETPSHGHGGPKLVVNPNTEMVYVMDADNKKIIEIDPEAGKISNTITLDFTPSQLAWFGVQSTHDNSHEGHEGHNH